MLGCSLHSQAAPQPTPPRAKGREKLGIIENKPKLITDPKGIKMKKIAAIGATLLVCISNTHAADVYKWIDDQGKVHYSAQPPKEKPQTVEVKKYGGASPSTYKMSEEDRKEWADAYTKELSKVDETKTPLNCSTAITNANEQFDTLFVQGKRNLDNGSITQAQYDKAVGALRKARQEVSFSRCQAATGVERAFYECMTNGNNHLVGCGTKNDFSK